VERRGGGERVAGKKADGSEPETLRTKARNAAAANFVHSLDATHLILSVNAAHVAGIHNVVTVHDCYGTTAPRVMEFQQIVRSEMSKMYRRNDVLTDLWAQNGAPNDIVPPEAGGLNPLAVAFGSYVLT